MARFGNCLYFIALLYFTEIFSSAMLDSEEEKEIYLCIMRQICECDGGAENYKRCYSLLKKETSRWIFEEAKKCNLGTFTSFEDVVRIGCETPRDDFVYINFVVAEALSPEYNIFTYPCFMKMEENVRKRTVEASKNPMKYDEYLGLDASRSCCLPNLSMCVDNPDDCF